MSPAGDDRPRKRSGGSEGRGKPDEPQEARRGRRLGRAQRRQETRIHGLRPQRPDRPETLGAKGKKPVAGQAREGTEGEAALPRLPLPAQPARPDPQAQPRQHPQRRRAAGGIRGFFARLTGGKRPWLRWVLIALVGWLLLSFISFAISAQIQKGKLPQSAKDALKGGPAVLAGQNILILGGDRRGKTQHNASGSEGAGPAAGGHDHGAARLTHLVPQALHPARQLRGDPELRRAEDQCLTRLQHPEHQREPRRDHQDGRELPRDRHQPHRDRRFRRLRRASSTRSAG